MRQNDVVGSGIKPSVFTTAAATAPKFKPTTMNNPFKVPILAFKSELLTAFGALEGAI